MLRHDMTLITFLPTFNFLMIQLRKCTTPLCIRARVCFNGMRLCIIIMSYYVLTADLLITWPNV